MTQERQDIPTAQHLAGIKTMAANALWWASCMRGALAFARAMENVAGAQAALLWALLARNAETEWGRRYGFAGIRSIREFQATVPLTTYEDYSEAIERIGAGKAGVLTRDPVRLLELTSGSTAPTKLLPYTDALKQEFQRAISPWIADLYKHHPALLRGTSYWSVSPIVQQQTRTAGGIPIGFEEDSEYLGRVQGALLRSLLAVPPLVRQVAEMETFRYVTLLFLLRQRSLALISVWNPTFLTLLVAPLEGWGERLAQDIERGTLTPPTPLDPALHAVFQRLLRPDALRAAEVRAALNAGDAAQRHTALWPHLRLLSCWADAAAVRYADDLARLFPQAQVQGKGLLATEGVVSLPLIGQPGAVLAVRSHFFEFLPADEEHPRLAHQLDEGRQYEVILTTGGGLYRYRMHDWVEVVGHRRGCPLLRFVGKGAAISDWFGEKVHERHVQQTLDRLLDAHDLHPAFVMVACDEANHPPAYTLFIEAPTMPAAALAPLAPALEQALLDNFHYRYCRELGQLGPARLFRITGGALKSYQQACQRHGQRAGDIKPVALHRLGGWSRAFMGDFES